MSDSEDSDLFEEQPKRSFQDIHAEIERCKKNPATSGMFVSGWDDPDEDVEEVKDPKGKKKPIVTKLLSHITPFKYKCEFYSRLD